MAIRMAFSMGVDMAGQGRLMVIDKVSIINPLPASYESQLKQVDGRAPTSPTRTGSAATTRTSRTSSPPSRSTRELAARLPEGVRRCPEDQKKAWFADRTGAIVGADTAKKYGWKVGRRVPIQGTIYRRPDGGPWEFTIDGIYDSNDQGGRQDQLHLPLPVPARDDPGAERVPRQVQLVRVHDRRSGSRAADRREDRRDVRQLAVGDEDQHREGVRRPTGRSRSATSARS